MSGLNYHLKCPSCGLSSPAYPVVPGPVPRDSFSLPASTDGGFVAHTIPLEPGELRPQTTAHVDAARGRGELVSAPRLLGDGRVELYPPLPCPRCSTVLTHGALGGAGPREASFDTLDDLVRATRALAQGRTLESTSTTRAIVVHCSASVDVEGRRELSWIVQRASGHTVDVRPVVGDLIARLQAAGSDCSPPRLKPRKGRFSERPA